MTRFSIPKNIDELLDKVIEKIPSLKPFAIQDPGTEKFDLDKLHDLSTIRKIFETYFQVEVIGKENVPTEGRGLFAGNHGRTGFDAFLFAAISLEKIGRPVRGLTDRMFFRAPKLRDWIATYGGVIGTPENAVRLLKQDELVVVYPGGAREVLKSTHEAYHLFWGERLGFVRVAVDSHAPIIPFAGIGVEEMFKSLPGWDAIEQTKIVKTIEKTIGRRNLPPPPVVGLGLLPFPTKVKFYIGPAVETKNLNLSNKKTMLEFQKHIRSEVEALILKGLSEREELLANLNEK